MRVAKYFLLAVGVHLAVSSSCFASLFWLDFTNTGNAWPGAAGDLGISTVTLLGVDLGGGITADVTISATRDALPVNIHSDADHGLGVLDPPPSAGSGFADMLGTAGQVESLTISLDNFQGTSASAFKFTAIETGNSALVAGTDETNLGLNGSDPEVLNITTSALDDFDIVGTDSAQIHAIPGMPVLSAGGSYTFTLREEPGRDAIRITKLHGSVVPEPATIAIWSLLGLVGAGAYRRRRSRG